MAMTLIDNRMPSDAPWHSASMLLAALLLGNSHSSSAVSLLSISGNINLAITNVPGALKMDAVSKWPASIPNEA